MINVRAWPRSEIDDCRWVTVALQTKLISSVLTHLFARSVYQYYSQIVKVILTHSGYSISWIVHRLLVLSRSNSRKQARLFTALTCFTSSEIASYNIICMDRDMQSYNQISKWTYRVDRRDSNPPYYLINTLKDIYHFVRTFDQSVKLLQA